MTGTIKFLVETYQKLNIDAQKIVMGYWEAVVKITLNFTAFCI